MIEEYKKHLVSKMIRHNPSGFVSSEPINSILFDFQHAAVVWALNNGKAAVFLDCGMGKTFVQVEWAKHVHIYTGKPVLILAPLAVANQTIEEAKKLDVDISFIVTSADVTNGIFITNYEKLDNIDTSLFSGVVADESSILKNFTGKTKKLMMSKFADTPFKLACTATPSPNDLLEIGNHAEWLSVMKSNEMISRWFINDTMKAGSYRLRGHAVEAFWTWVTSWAVMASKPTDLGDFSDDGYELPELIIENEMVTVDQTRAFNEIDKKTGQRSLFLIAKSSATTMHKEKDITLERRMQVVVDLVARHEGEPLVIWVNKNNEQDMLKKMLPQAVTVSGSDSNEVKKDRLIGFKDGKYQVLITKPKIAAWGMNWQHCNVHIEASVDHSFEMFYQKIRRSYRFGQTKDVTVYRVYAETESHIVNNVYRKIQDNQRMHEQMVSIMKSNGMSLSDNHKTLNLNDAANKASGEGWEFWNGDAVMMTQRLGDESVDHWVQSPPFKGLYIYSQEVQDLGNCADDNEFYYQYQFILREQLRASKTGSYKSEHCKDLPLYAGRDGAMGLDDFPGQLIRAHEAAGWKFAGWETIWKDPVIEMQRTKNAGLLWSSAFCERGERCRQGMADYVLIFKKSDKEVETGHNALPIHKDVVGRCVDLWTNEWDSVQSPYHKGIDNLGIAVFDRFINDDEIADIRARLMDGRNLVVRLSDPHLMHKQVDLMKEYRMVFHSRVALTDGTWLVVFRKWVDDMKPIEHVNHKLIAPNGTEPDEHKYIGTMPPPYWDNDSHYSIGVWQRYASPVWFDFEGMPSTHDNIWFNVDQTNVFNFRIARSANDEKHICPLQIDVIENSIKKYTKKGDLVASAFGGVGSEPATALRLGRRAWACELKESYWHTGIKNIKLQALANNQMQLF